MGMFFFFQRSFLALQRIGNPQASDARTRGPAAHLRHFVMLTANCEPIVSGIGDGVSWRISISHDLSPFVDMNRH
jgi:hypothetical protein